MKEKVACSQFSISNNVTFPDELLRSTFYYNIQVVWYIVDEGKLNLLELIQGSGRETDFMIM